MASEVESIGVWFKMVECKKFMNVATGFALMILVGCGTTVEAEKSGYVGDFNEGSPGEFTGLTDGENFEVVTVQAIENADGFLLATLMYPDGEFGFIDLSAYLTVMIETNEDVRQGTYKDVSVGDVIRIYESHSKLIEKIVIVR